MNPLTLVHVVCGSLALLAGAAALSAPKGGRWHARAGTLFFGAMLAMALTGAAIAAVRVERGTVVIGLLTAYLVATAWTAARRRDGRAGRMEAAAMLVALGCAATMGILGTMALSSPTGRVDSLPAAAHFPFAALAGLAAALDLNFILRGTVSGRQRIARHLWRMCAALAIAAFSFFLGQQDEFPVAWQGLPIWFVPPLATLAAMIFWLFRVRFAAAFRHLAPRQRSRGDAAAPSCPV